MTFLVLVYYGYTQTHTYTKYKPMNLFISLSIYNYSSTRNYTLLNKIPEVTFFCVARYHEPTTLSNTYYQIFPDLL